MQKELQLIGMHKNEAKAYEALVKFGPCRAGLLINKLDIHRNLVYQSLENLVLKGYATKVIKKGVWTFQITDPNSLLSHMKQRAAVLHELVREIKTHQHKAIQQIVVYEGIDSYRNYWVESLERLPSGTTDYCAGAPSNKDWIKMMGASYKKYLELRLKKKIQWKTLHFRITPSEREMLKKYPDLTEYRLWPRDIECIGNFNVIHDTVILHAITDPPRIIEIRDPSLVLVFKNYFDMMWGKAEPVRL
jgi:sugar-specific transcriptional regulator TrmB